MKQLVFFLIFLLPIVANAASIDDIAKALVTYFPKVSGKITAVDREKVGIQSENETGLSTGVLLSAYQTGAPFYHPVTHAELGHVEEEITLLEVTEVGRGQLTAKVVGAQAPAIGTLIRLTAARILIGVGSGVTEAERFVIRELRSALEETGRFTVAANEAHLYSIALTVSPPPVLVKVQMQNVKTGSIVADIELMLESSNGSDTILESLQYQLFEKRQKGISAK